ncbi:O-antigen ligase family protein [Neorhizobium lilium]|uniref:O-antigen ligase family protein n=1 Tax=Neorhizobium lilium TaxID=2503024 RepID=A0A3S3SAK9_9HYPH|nr:O-antigen ligase family protein [Neorhizobium lilium]RWX81120.1 O-antigen ligase family protein [Neorhizobium lilium]
MARNPARSAAGSFINAITRVDAVPVMGALLFMIATLAFWTQMQPFRSLQDYAAVQDTTQSNDLRKYTTLAISALVIAFLYAEGKKRHVFDLVKIPIVVAVLSWSAVTSLVSANPSLALNRLVLAAITVQIAYAVPLLFKDATSFIRVLGICATVVIIASYLGVLFVPDLSIHTVRDVTEQPLAGNWRGIFGHKNDLSAMAALFIFLGIVVARTNNVIWGIAIVISSAGLLIMSEGKTSILITIPALFGGFLLVWLRSRTASAAVAYIPILVMVFFTLGGVLFPSLEAFFKTALPDPTFTGRTDAWSIAVQAIARAPVLGYGYMIFWDLGMAYGVTSSVSLPTTFSHAHNGFLDVFLSGGLLGLTLVVVWTVVLPFRHIQKVKLGLKSKEERAILAFFASVWMFTLMNASLEAILFNRSNPIWYTFLIALGCLHAWSQAHGRRT